MTARLVAAQGRLVSALREGIIEQIDVDVYETVLSHNFGTTTTIPNGCLFTVAPATEGADEGDLLLVELDPENVYGVYATVDGEQLAYHTATKEEAEVGAAWLLRLSVDLLTLQALDIRGCSYRKKGGEA